MTHFEDSPPPEVLGAVKPKDFGIVLLLIALALGIALNWTRFLRNPLGIDEHVSFWIADGSSPSTLLDRSFNYSATPPLSFILQRIFLDAFGPHEWSLRLPAALSYLGSIVAVWWLGRRWLTEPGGGLAAILLAVHPAIEKIAVAGRPYSIGLLLGLLTMHATARLREEPRKYHWLVWSLLNLALIQTHYLFAALWGAELAWLLWPNAIPIGRSAVICLAVLLGCLWSVLPGLIHVWDHRAFLNWTTRMPELADVWRLFFPVSDVVRSPILWCAVGSPILCQLIRGRWRPVDWVDRARWNRNRRAMLRTMCWFLIPVLGLWLVGRFWIPSLAAERYLVIYVPAAVIFLSAAALALNGMGSPMMAAVLLVLLPATVFQLIPVQTRQLDVESMGWARAAGLVSQRGRIVLVASGLAEMSLVPVYRDDTIFQDYATCRLGRLYTRTDATRMSLPMFWTGDMAEFYGRAIARARSLLDQNEPLGVWLVYANDTDLLRESARRAEDLLKSLGAMERVREQDASVISVYYTIAGSAG